MRKDMAQLLVERPRLYRGETYHGHRRRLNGDPDAPTKLAMRRPYFEQKQFNEYFAPILGYLRKAVGRPWDKVFSELSAALSGGATVIEHVKMHVLRDFVTLHPVWREGVPCYSYDRYVTPITRSRNRGFYVDRGGLLQQARAKLRKVSKPKRWCVPIDDNTAYYKLDGVWFRVWTKRLEAASMENIPLYDVLLNKWVKSHGTSTPYQPEMMWQWYVEGTHGLGALLALHGTLRIAYRKEPISNRTIRREKLDKRLR